MEIPQNLSSWHGMADLKYFTSDLGVETLVSILESSGGWEN